MPDPLGFGLVNSLARRGGNATGLSLMAVDLSGKRLELLKQAVPTLSRVALLTDPKTDPFREHTIKANQAAASALGITLWRRAWDRVVNLQLPGAYWCFGPRA